MCTCTSTENEYSTGTSDEGLIIAGKFWNRSVWCGDAVGVLVLYCSVLDTGLDSTIASTDLKCLVLQKVFVSFSFFFFFLRLGNLIATFTERSRGVCFAVSSKLNGFKITYHNCMIKQFFKFSDNIMKFIVIGFEKMPQICNVQRRIQKDSKRYWSVDQCLLPLHYYVPL